MGSYFGYVKVVMEVLAHACGYRAIDCLGEWKSPDISPRILASCSRADGEFGESRSAIGVQEREFVHRSANQSRGGADCA